MIHPMKQLIRMHSRHVGALVTACALIGALPAQAAGEPVPPREPEGVVTLNSSATIQVPNDWLSVQFSTTRQGVDANAVQAALKESLGAALALARPIAKA